MMINRITGPVDPAKNASFQKEEVKNSFEQVLNAAVDAGKCQAPQKVFPPGSVSPIPLVDVVNSRQSVLQQADTLVELIDDYSMELADPKRTPRKIEGLLTRMEEELYSLKGRTGNMVEHDEKLLGLVNDIAVTANVEIFKFYRGDYA